ncbi:hypothetical protein ACNKHW_03795 [Shigella flexneri]
MTTSHINQSHHSDAVAVDLHLVNCDLENCQQRFPVARFLKLQSPLIAQRKPPARNPILNNTSTGEATGVGVRLMNEEIKQYRFEAPLLQISTWLRPPANKH